MQFYARTQKILALIYSIEIFSTATNMHCPLYICYFRIQAVYAHVQTFFNLPSLDVPIEINNIDTEHLSEGYEARASYLKYDIFFIYGLFYKLRFSFFPFPSLET